jgi:Spy/CpxP family protein refolding chaperone
MKTSIRNMITSAVMVLMALAVIAILGQAAPALAQQPPGDLPPAQGNQTGPAGDPIRQLNLSAEQIEKIRSIREQAKDNRVAFNQRLRRAQMALDEAIESDNASETLVEQRSQELAEAQVAVTRMRALTELRIRKVLTPEQLTKLRSLKQQALQFRQDRQNELQGPMTPRERQQRRRDALQPNGNFRPDLGPRKQPGQGQMNQRP